MDAAQPCETPDPAGERTERTERTERHLRMLAELAEIGMDLAREVRRQASDQTGEAPPAADLALTFSRIARAVRQTVALEAKLAEEAQSGRAERSALGVSDRWRSARRKRQVKAIVFEMIEAGTERDSEADRLGADLRERLEDDDEEADFADRPIGELVARICRDLGVTPDWSLFEDEDWAIEEARSRLRGSPYVAAGRSADHSDAQDHDTPPPGIQASDPSSAEARSFHSIRRSSA